MSVKLKVLSAGALFFLGGALVTAQQSKKDSLKTESIEGVVVLGFGKKQAVKELTGSVGKVGKEIADVSSASVDKALAGRVAGVQTGMSTGQPGGAAAIRVRGISSINGRNNPIIIVDGVRIAQGDLTSNTTTANILANLNEADIDNVTVLKDAVSTAVYGADAGSGVVIITTKSGRKGAAKFNVSAETGVSYRAITGHEGLSTPEWKKILAQALSNRYSTDYATPEAAIQGILRGGRGSTAALRNIFNSNTSTDWRKETENTSGALMQRINASVSGGNDRLTYYSSLGYFEQTGVARGSSFKRLSGSTRVNYKATDKLTLATDIQASYSKISTLAQGGTFANPIMGQYFLRPTEVVKNADGSYNLGTSGRMSNGLFNVAALQDLNSQVAATARVFANIQADYKIAKGLNYKFVIAPEFINIEEDEYRSPLHGDGFNLKGALTSYTSRYFNFNIQNILSYDFKLGEKNNFNASLIQEAYKSDYRLIGGYGNTVGSTNLRTLDSFITPRGAYGRRAENSRGGYAITAHYDYDKLILVDLSGRQDRVSNFWEENKTGYFWSAGVGIDLARLNAIKSIDAISQLKFSASYGQVGNLPGNDVIPYATYRYLSNYGGEVGAYPFGVENRDLRWEIINPLNLGFDLGLFNNRLKLGIAYYDKKTSDMILDVPISPAQAGFSNIGGSAANRQYVNIGSMSNSGFEFTIGGDIIKNTDLRWSLNANISTLKNRVLSLVNGQDVISGTSILREGQVANAFYLRKWAGVDKSNGAPLWYKNGVDGETTSVYSEAKEAIQGSRYAKLFGGVDTQVSYKGFSLDAQLSFGFGNKIYDSWAGYLLSDGQYTATYPGYRAQLDYWTPDNPNALNPAPVFGGNRSSAQSSSRFLYKGDYLRLRTLKVSYTFNKEALGNIGLDSVQLYLLGNNIWTYTYDKNLKFDPDLAISGSANLTLPPMKSYSLGINLNF